MKEPISNTEVCLKGWGVGGKGDGAKLVPTFTFDIKGGSTHPMAAYVLNALPDLATAMQRGAIDPEHRVEMAFPTKDLGDRRFTATFWPVPAERRGTGSMQADIDPSLLFVDCVLTGKVNAAVVGDVATMAIKVSTPTAELHGLGIHELAMLNHTNLWMDIEPQEGDATNAELTDEAPRQRKQAAMPLDGDANAEPDARGSYMEQAQAIADAQTLADAMAANGLKGSVRIGNGDPIPFGLAPEGSEGPAEPQPDVVDGEPAIPAIGDIGPWVLSVTAPKLNDSFTLIVLLKNRFGMMQADAKRIADKARNGETVIIPGAWAADAAQGHVDALKAIPGVVPIASMPEDAEGNTRWFTVPSEYQIRTLFGTDGSALEAWLKSITEEQIRAVHFEVTQQPTKGAHAKVLEKIMVWAEKKSA